MDTNFLTVELHNEYAKRMEEEHRRQNYRLQKLESSVEETKNLALSIERLTLSVQSMVEEQRTQSERLETLENRDGEMWRKVVGYTITAVLGIVIGYIFKQIGF